MAKKDYSEPVSIDVMLAYVFQALSREEEQALDTYLDEHPDDAEMMDNLLDYCLEQGIKSPCGIL